MPLTPATPEAPPAPWLVDASNAFDVMGHPVRRYLLAVLASEECASLYLAERVQHVFGFGWPAVSKHLKILHGAGFVRVRDAWPQRLYRLDDDAIGRLEAAVAGLRAAWARREGGGYTGAFEPAEALWPRRRASRRPADAADAIDRILRDEGIDPDTGQRMIG